MTKRINGQPMAKEAYDKLTNGANLDFGEKDLAAVNKLRGHIDAAEHKHGVLGLDFRKYISDGLEELRDDLPTDKNSAPADRNQYLIDSPAQKSPKTIRSLRSSSSWNISPRS